MAWRSCAWAEDIATAAHALDHSGQEDGRNGMINTITLTFDRPKLTPEDEKNLMAAHRNNK